MVQPTFSNSSPVELSVQRSTVSDNSFTEGGAEQHILQPVYWVKPQSLATVLLCELSTASDCICGTNPGKPIVHASVERFRFWANNRERFLRIVFES
jgi:hypothetical protein